METLAAIGPRLGVARTCAAFDLPTATYYRRRCPTPEPSVPRPSPARTLPAAERAAVLAVLHEPRFVDRAPAAVQAQLLDEDRYLCSERTMYRILAEHQEVRERRDQLRHPPYAAPQLLATRPNQLWSWDITKLLGPAKWTYFYLYVILDVFSRYAVGWMVAHRETAALAERLIRATCARQGIVPGTLTLHADRGSSMTSKPVALLLSDLGVTKSHSRPYVSDDNPFSEAQFKTLKYRPAFPDRFGSIVDARAFCQAFFPWYNGAHHHSGIGLLTPEDVHLGRAAHRVAARADVLARAYAAHPERFVRGVPQPPAVPSAVWINAPKSPLANGEEKTDLTGSPRSDAPNAGQGTDIPDHGPPDPAIDHSSARAQH
jgi:putative transposase